MSVQEDPENNQVHIFIPKCPTCHERMAQEDIRGMMRQDEIGRVEAGPGGAGLLKAAVDNNTIAPAITHFRLLYRCKRHYNQYWLAPIHIIEAMNKYPSSRIVYHHVIF